MGDKFLITGFFDRKNWGDDLFQWTYIQIFEKDPRFKNWEAIYVATDDLRKRHFVGIKAVVLAGGDVLANYFINRIQQFNVRNIPVYAFSAGVPYASCVIDGILDKMSFVMVRARRDIELLKHRYHLQNQFMYHPDVAVLLPKMMCRESHVEGSFPKTKPSQRNIGVCLIRPMIKNNVQGYEKFCQAMATALNGIVETQDNVHLWLIPFNTNKENHYECDFIINQDVYNLLDEKAKRCTSIVTDTLNIEQMYCFFKQLDLTLVQRYHAHLLSMVTGVPLVPIGISQKTTNFLQDMKYPLKNDFTKTSEQGQVCDLDVTKLEKTVAQLLTNEDNMRQSLLDRYKAYVQPYQKDQFQTTLYKTLKDLPHQEFSATAKRPNTMQVVERVARCVVAYLCQDASDTNTTNTNTNTNLNYAKYIDDVIYGTGSLGRIAKEFDREDADFLASLILYEAVKTPYPDYYWGLKEKLLSGSFRLLDDLKWMWHDFNKRKQTRLSIAKPSTPLYNLTKLGLEDFQGLHRSGWSYVLSGLLQHHSDQAPIILDNYVDRTFHWAKDIYKYTDVIPYKDPWFGFVHHTAAKRYTPYNIDDMFKEPLFLESLKTCQGLFVFSNSLKKDVETLLEHYRQSAEDELGHIPVTVFKHPTEIPTQEHCFTWEKFMGNEDRSIVHVGSWLRDTFGIYALTPKNHIKKKILVGSNMDDYQAPAEIKVNVQCSGKQVQSDLYKMLPEEKAQQSNKFVTGMLDHLHETLQSVEKIERLNNEEYDQLLSENIVFLKLIDASAVNTVVECLVRNTPLLVNKHAAMVEALGEDYPFFYETLAEANKKAGDFDLIKQTHAYMKTLDKTPYHIDYFVDQVAQVIESNTTKQCVSK